MFYISSTLDIEAVSMKSVPCMSGLFAGGFFDLLVPLLEKDHIKYMLFLCIAYTVSFL